MKLTADPANGEVIGNVPDLSKEEVLEAVKAAEEAFPAWSNTPPKVSQRAASMQCALRRAWQERVARMGRVAFGRLISTEQARWMDS